MLLIDNEMKVKRCDCDLPSKYEKLQQLLNLHWLDDLVNLQLSLTESEMSKIGTIKVEAIINPTNAELDLKDGVGEKDQFIFLYIFLTNHFPAVR